MGNAATVLRIATTIGGQWMQDKASDHAVPIAEEDDGLVDVTALPLEELVSSEETVLTNALRRLLREIDSPHEVIAGWNSHQP